MSDFQLILREWVKTSGFLTNELVKRFFLVYPLLCIASDCYLQVQVAFQAWFETIEHANAAPESEAPAAPPPASSTLAPPPQTPTQQTPSPPPPAQPTPAPQQAEGPPPSTTATTEGYAVRVPSRGPEDPAVEPVSNAEQAVDIEQVVRDFFDQETVSVGSNAEERPE